MATDTSLEIMYQACRAANLRGVRRMLDQGVPVDGRFKGWSWIDATLLQPNARHDYWLEHDGMSFRRRWQPRIVSLLLERGISLEAIGRDGLPPLFLFACHGIGVSEALQQGVDANVTAPLTKETPLHVATQFGDNRSWGSCDVTSGVHTLLIHGADPNLRTVARRQTAVFSDEIECSGQTPLHFAMAFGSDEMVRVLIEAGADLEAEDANGHLPTPACCVYQSHRRFHKRSTNWLEQIASKTCPGCTNASHERSH